MSAQTRQNLLFSLILTGLGAFVNVFHTVVDRMSLSIGQDALASGMLLSVYAIGSLSSLVASSSLADRAGKRPVVLASLLAMSAGFLLLFFSSSALPLYAGLFLFGFGFAPTEAMTSALLGDENPQNASMWMNISQAGFGLGAIGGPLLAVAYLGRIPSYNGLFLWTSFVSLGFAGLMMVNFKSKPRGEVSKQSTSLNMFSVLKDRRFRFLALTIFLYLGYESVSPSYIKQLFLKTGESEALSAGMISFFWGSMIIGRLIGTRLSGRELKSIQAFTVFVVLGEALLVLPGSTALRILAVCLIGFGCGPVWPMLVAMAARQFPQRSGAAIGVMMLCSMAGITIFPPLIGTLPHNLSATFLLCAALGVLVIAVTARTAKA